MKIKDYRIVKGSAVPMELEVRKQLKDGWIPQGGLVVDQGMFYQAMVLESEMLLPTYEQTTTNYPEPGIQIRPIS
jgi:hypothetical protein